MARMARKNHNIDSIIEYWKNNMDEVPRSYARSIGWSEPFCFACHRVSESQASWYQSRNLFELAHLSDFSVTGDDEVSNIIPLCSTCHRSMPSFLDRRDALVWLNSPDRQKEASHRRLPKRAAASAQTSAALQKLKAQGVRLGRPVVMSAEVKERIVRDKAEGKTLAGIARQLTLEGVPTSRGGVQWYASTVKGALVSAALDNQVDFPV